MDEKIKTARIDLGQFFKKRREDLKLSEQMVADHIGITASTLRGIEKGRFSWDIDLQHKLCRALEIKPFFAATLNELEEDYSLRKEDDPQRYHGFYISENLLLYPNQLAIQKLVHPRLFIRFNYGESYFASFEEWKANHTDLQWLDPDDKPESPEEIEDVLIDCWNFLALHEREEERLSEKDDNEF